MCLHILDTRMHAHTHTHTYTPFFSFSFSPKCFIWLYYVCHWLLWSSCNKLSYFCSFWLFIILCVNLFCNLCGSCLVGRFSLLKWVLSCFHHYSVFMCLMFAQFCYGIHIRSLVFTHINLFTRLWGKIWLPKVKTKLAALQRNNDSGNKNKCGKQTLVVTFFDNTVSFSDERTIFNWDGNACLRTLSKECTVM